MRCLGILSVRNEIDEKHKGRIKLSQTAAFDRGIPVVVAEFLATKEELGKKSSWQKRRIFKKGEKFLHHLGADVVVPTLLCSRTFGIPVRGAMTVETALTPADMPAALEVVLGEYQESPKGKTGWIVDKGCSPVCLSLLKAMSQRVEFLNIVTEEREKAEAMGELLWDEYGVSPDVYLDLRVRDWKNTIVVRMDTGKILVDGMTALQGRKWSLDLDGYQIDLPELLSRCPEVWDVLEPLGWRRGKSG